MIEDLPRLLSGLAFGLVFGALLHRGRVAEMPVIVRQLTLEEGTVAKIMGTAILVGAVGVYAMHGAALVELHVKPLQWGGLLAGGICFGAGLAVYGYCPGTGVAASGAGKRDAMVGVLGGLVGAGAFVLAHPHLQPLVRWGDAGEVTLPEILGVSPWLILGSILAAVGLGAALLRARRRPGRPRPSRPSRHEATA